MTERFDRLRLRRIAAGASYRSFTLFGASGPFRDLRLHPIMTERFDHLRLRRIAAGACYRSLALLRTSGLLRDRLHPIMPERVDHLRLRRVAAGACYRSLALFGASGFFRDLRLNPVVTERSGRHRFAADLLMAHSAIDDLLIGARLCARCSFLVLADGFTGSMPRRRDHFRLSLVAARAAHDFLARHGASRLLRDLRLGPIVTERGIFVRSRVRCVAAVALRRLRPVLGAFRIAIRDVIREAVPEGSRLLCFAADLFLAHRAIDDLLIGARLCARCGLFVLTDGLAGCMTRCGDRQLGDLLACICVRKILPALTARPMFDGAVLDTGRRNGLVMH